LLCLSGAIAGYGLCSLTENRWALMAIAFLLLGLGQGSFALLFALAKRRLDREEPAVCASGMAALRLMASLSWAIGPAVAAVLIRAWGFAGVFRGGALCGGAALLSVLAGWPRTIPDLDAEHEHVSIRELPNIWMPAVALTLFHAAMFMGANAQSVVAVDVLGGSERDVGLLFSLCAALEVMVMGVFVLRPAKRASRMLLAAGFVAFAGFFLSPVLWPSLSTLYWAQSLRAIGIGVIGVIGMLFVQQLMPNQAGAASALFGNTVSGGWLLSGIGTGGLAQAFGYWSIFSLCAALSVIGGLLFLIAARAPPA